MTTVEVAFGDDVFVADSTQVVRYGWTEADPQQPEMDVQDDDIQEAAPAEAEVHDEDETESA